MRCVRPTPRTGPVRVRGRWPFRFLQTLALLLGALSLLNAAPAQAQDVWSATLTVKDNQGDKGCYGVGGTTGRCTGGLSEDDFTHNSISYKVMGLLVSTGAGNIKYLNLWLNKAIPNALKSQKLCLGTTGFTLSAGTISNDIETSYGNNYVRWSSEDVSGIPSWSVDDTVKVSLSSSCQVTFGFENETGYLVKENVGSFVAAVEATKAVAADTTITIAATDGTSTPSDEAARRGTDYGGAATFTVTMSAGENRAEFVASIIDDNVLEPTKKFTWTITSVSSGAVGTPASSVVTIQDNDVVVQFESAAYEVVESSLDSTAIVLTAEGALDSDFSVGLRYKNYGTTPRTGTGTCQGDRFDHLWIPSTKSFLAGETSIEILVWVCNDDVDRPEYDKSFELSITLDDTTAERVAIGEKASTRFTIRDDDHPRGVSPGMPVLTGVESGSHAPTADTLSFMVSCVSPGRSPVTDYVLRLVNTDDESEVHTAYLPGPSPACSHANPAETMRVSVEGLSAGTTYRARAFARNLVGRISPQSDWVELATTGSGLQVMGGGTEDGTPREALTAAFEGAPLEHDSKTAFALDVRFSAVLGTRGRLPKPASFTVSGGKVKGVRYVEPGLWRVRVKPASTGDVTVTLEGGRDCGETGAVCTIYGQALTNSPSFTVAGPGQAGPYAALIAQMREWRNDPKWRSYKAHTDRWDRALLAFGETVSDATLTPMTAAQAQGFADRGWTRWVEVAAALHEIEAAHAPAPPVVTIASGAPVIEGTVAGFTLRAVPAPATDLVVAVSVAQRGAFAKASALGVRTVTIPAGTATAAFTVATVDDDAGETEGAVVATLAAGSGYTLGDAARASVKVTDNDKPDIVTKRSIAREGTDDAVVFRVRLNRPASHTVTVDWTTADGAGAWARTPPATAGSDYTTSSGTLTFAAGETLKSMSVPILDDAIDEGTEYFLLKFSNPQGGTLAARYRETQGLIRNDDHLQSMWLSRFGRTVGSQVTDAVSERLTGGLAPGAHVTFAGQSLDLARAGDEAAWTKALTGLARTFGAHEASANDDSFPAHGLSGTWDAPSATAARRVTGRELLLGSSFHMAGTGEGSAPGLAAWGRVAHGDFDGEHADDTGHTQIDGEVLTGVLGVDADWGRLLAGVAVSLSEGDGRYDSPGVDRGQSGKIESTMTTVSPYVRFNVTERVSAWGQAGWGTGDMIIRFDDAGTARIRTDLRMRMGAIGARGALLEQDDTGSMDLALKADAFYVRMESEKAVNSVNTEADASRVRLVLEGGRSFALGEGAIFRPSLEFGVRHDGGDAETGTGVEVGGGVTYSNEASGLSVDVRARMLVAHADSDYEEWGASANVQLDPGESGRGLSLSLAPTFGAVSSTTERLWGMRDARSLTPGGEFEAVRGLTAEAGYGLAHFDGRFTGTPNLGFGLADGGARDWRLGWRLTPARQEALPFTLELQGTRQESRETDRAPEHRLQLQLGAHW